MALALATGNSVFILAEVSLIMMYDERLRDNSRTDQEQYACEENVMDDGEGVRRTYDRNQGLVVVGNLFEERRQNVTFFLICSRGI